MARKPSSSDTTSVTLTQQALSAIRQMVNAIGWAKTIEDIAVGGELLVKVLPALDSTAWVKTAEEVQAMSAEDRIAYAQRDREWTTKQVTFAWSSTQKSVATKAFKHWVDETAKAGKLGPSEWLTELLGVLDVSGDGSRAE